MIRENRGVQRQVILKFSFLGSFAREKVYSTCSQIILKVNYFFLLEKGIHLCRCRLYKILAGYLTTTFTPDVSAVAFKTQTAPEHTGILKSFQLKALLKALIIYLTKGEIFQI